jgi:hypothetical protein
MEIEIIGLVGFVYAATSLGALVHERRMDVLYGPYIEARKERRTAFLAGQIWKAARLLADQFRWRARNMVYLASIAAC